MYRVIRAFKDLEDDGKIYNEGDIYPTEGKSKERIAFLKSDENKLGTPVIKYVKETLKDKADRPI